MTPLIIHVRFTTWRKHRSNIHNMKTCVSFYQEIAVSLADSKNQCIKYDPTTF